MRPTFGRISGVFSQLLIRFQNFIPTFIFVRLVQLLFTVMSFLEKRWFLYYVRRNEHYFVTKRKIENNRFCPKTVSDIYEFWISHPDHEAFEGLSK
jgi:hypothetical protein